jgi:RHS repeat-associated protein
MEWANIRLMGTHTFGYGKVSRLTAANLYLEPTSSTSLRFQTFSYDAFGNLQSIAGSSARSTPTSASTNRLAAPATYDAQGNVTSWNGSQYDYDPFNLMWHYKTVTAGDEWVYLYTADDERVWSYKADNTSLWALRDLGANVLREYSTAGAWAVQSDYVYREGLLLAAETAGGLRHFHLDHLRTPRLVTNGTGLQAGYHVYYPYGEEATAFNQDTIRAKFTGHERDLGNLGGSGDDLDYMHARFCSPLTGRFWGVDPKHRRKATSSPQSLNRYVYGRSNPVKYLDPNGREIVLGAGSPTAALQAARLMLPPDLRQSIDLRSGKDGKAIFTIDNSKRSSDINFKSLQRAINSPGKVELNLLSLDSSIRYQKPDGNPRVTTFGAENKKGLTLPSAGSNTGNEPGFSPTRGLTQIFINSALNPSDQAPVLAAELGAHAVPALLGKPSVYPTQEEHAAAEAPFIAAAKANSPP